MQIGGIPLIILIACATQILIYGIMSYTQIRLHQSKVNEISYISGFVSSSCKYLDTESKVFGTDTKGTSHNEQNCQSLVKWGQQMIEKLHE
jgi:hypothetical protein